MRIRSILMVPGDRADLIPKAVSGDADVVLLDLEDSVGTAGKAAARDNIAACLEADSSRRCMFVRVNSLGSGLIDDDLGAVLPFGPAGIQLPKSQGGGSVDELSDKLTILERKHGLPEGRTRIMAIALEDPAAIFQLDSYRGSSDRLIGLTWGGEDLRSALGAKIKSHDNGTLTEPFKLARLMTLYAARGAGVRAYDTVYRNTRDAAGLKAYAEAAARDGFAGMISISPRQTPIINEVFSPTATEVARARHVVSVYEANSGQAIIVTEEGVLDQHQYDQARHLLATEEDSSA